MDKVSNSGGVRRSFLSRLAWLPIPILLAALVVFWAADWQGSYESAYLLLALNLVFSTLVCLFIAYLIARSFLVRATPGLLLLGCGVVIWGPAGVVATAAAHGDANVSITIYNSCVWLSALCHLAGVSLSLRPGRSLSPPALWLPAAYALAVGAIAVVTLSALTGWMPAFFVEGRGGTPVRQLVLMSAMIMFALTASLLSATSRKPLSDFAYWYALALTLIVTGLAGVLLQSYYASVLGWTGRATQSLGGLYMLIAAIASVRESHVWGISLEAALRESEDRYRAMVETAPDAIVVHRNARFLYANRTALSLVGADSFAQLARRTVLDFFRLPDRALAGERMRLATAGNGLPTREGTLLRLDGREVIVEFHTAPADFQGSRAVLTIIRDVTERKRAEEALKIKERAIAFSLNAIAMADPQGNLTYVNPAFLKLWAYEDKSEVLGKSILAFWKEPRQALKVVQAIQNGQGWVGELVAVRKDGAHLSLHLSASAVRNEAGTPTCIVASFLDITERKRAEQALRQSEQDLVAELDAAQRLQELSTRLIQADDVETLYGQILDTAVAIMRSDYASIQTLYPERGPGGGLRLLGYRGFNPQAAQFWEWVRPDSQSPCAVALRMGQRTIVPDVLKCEFMAGSDDLETCLQTGIRAVQTTPLVSRGGQILGMISTHWRAPHEPTVSELRRLDVLARQAADLIERKRAEEALRELNATLEAKVAQRTAELEQRARQLQKLTLELAQAEDRERQRIATILHEDLQQQIAGAKFHLSLVRSRAGHDASQQAMVDTIDEMLKEVIEKSRRLSHDLSPAVLHMNDLGEVLRWLAGRMQAEHGLTVRIDIAGEANLESEALTMFLFRATQEMLFNVIRHAQVSEASIRVRRLGRHLCLSVADRGRGFDPRELKETPGFGLLSIRERVELLGGRMTIKSVNGNGSRFHIVVPHADALAKPETASR
jgi:PAS domain S-box-containing protein